jgi:23S rRNA (uracil1939-C5)-methyltransferase
MKKHESVEVVLDKIVGGGQALGTLADGRKLFAWGGLPSERVIVQPTKKKTNYIEGIVTEILQASPERVVPRDDTSYLSTSPWQILSFDAEQRHKAELIEEAFALHGIKLPESIDIYSDGNEYNYRNKVEFSWYGDDSSGVEMLHLAFFRRGSKGKIIVDDSALLPPEMIQLARRIRDTLQSAGVNARQLKTLLIRCDASRNCVWQLYVKDTPCDFADTLLNADLPAQGGEVVYSTPKSPASVITERLARIGDTVLTDTVLGVPFRYATEGFFQVNLPVYEQALRDMKQWVDDTTASTHGVLDLYSGVGSIGLTIGGPNVTLIEINEHAVREMKRNITELGSSATPVLAASEQALDYITTDKIIIIDPPRAGLHAAVVAKLLEARPPRIIYLSCNPVTQARDIALLADAYKIKTYKGYNFFPRTPHIEGLAILDLR